MGSEEALVDFCVAMTLRKKNEEEEEEEDILQPSNSNQTKGLCRTNRITNGPQLVGLWVARGSVVVEWL